MTIQPTLKKPEAGLLPKSKSKTVFPDRPSCVRAAPLILTQTALRASGLILGVPSSSSQERAHNALKNFCVLHLLFSFHCFNFSLARNYCNANFLA